MGLVLRRVRALGAFRRVAAWIALNQGQKATHVRMGIPPEKIHVVPHFFEARDPVPPPKPDGDILFLGRLSPEKGLDILLRAWALVRPGARNLVIAGTGPEEASLRDLAKALKLSSVRFAGFVPPEGQPALWAQTSFSVLPSIWHEPFPLSFLESWAHARPVVASRVGAMAEEVTEGVTGFLAEPFSEKSLASKIQGMMDRPDQSVAMGLAGAKKVKEEHNRELWLQRIRQIFFNVLTTLRDREIFRP
jgi:glycosyltransferase involved in cell wall biosynthesis